MNGLKISVKLIEVCLVHKNACNFAIPAPILIQFFLVDRYHPSKSEF